ncbi:MAG: D-tyrosyl-tRNA(Tyr) deacylase [Bacteroidales bacterium]|jgi:D-tyrosyl-tRNA(Tyr) deacylase|nr:D-tyrosyl-tRNA(Tyr) deacylase [Bacteroidales bacterium]
MRIVIQKVLQASVTVEKKQISSIGKGLLILLGIENTDTDDDIDWLVKKMLQLRIFDDKNGVMNLSVQDIGGDVLIVSQFTLYASTKKGNRPSYIRASKSDFAIPIYEKFVQKTEEILGRKTSTGVFGAIMKVELINDGPVTIIIDTKEKE